MTKSVIVADDTPSVRDLLCAMIESCAPDVKIDAVDDGQSLVQKVREGDYALILTDNQMGQGMGGIDAIKAIRTFNQKVPIYMISGSDMLEEALRAGATEYLAKPVKLKEIQDVTNKYLSL